MGGMVRLHNQEAAAARTSETVKSNQQRPTGEYYCTTSDSYPGVAAPSTERATLSTSDTCYIV